MFSFSQLAVLGGRLVHHTLKIIQPGASKVDGTVQLIELRMIISCRQLIWGFILHANNLSEIIINVTRFQRRCSLLHGRIVFITGLNALIRPGDNAHGSFTCWLFFHIIMYWKLTLALSDHACIDTFGEVLVTLFCLSRGIIFQRICIGDRCNSHCTREMSNIVLKCFLDRRHVLLSSSGERKDQLS